MRRSSIVEARRHGLLSLIGARLAMIRSHRLKASPVNGDRGPTVVIVGPAPGQAGGISSVMSYLDAETRSNSQFDVIFLDTLRKGHWSVAKFVGVATRSAWIVAKSKIASRQVIFHLNVSTGGSTYRKWFVSRLCRLSLTPYVVHLHGSKYRTFFAESSPLVRRIVVSLFGSAETTIVLGRIWRDYVVEELGVDKKRVAIVANGTPAIARVPCEGVDTREKIRVVFSGRISEQKGVPELLQATDRVYEEFQDFELVLMGDSRDESLLSQARSRPYCVVTGWLAHEDVIRELASSHVFTLPSHDEGLPMAMIEAMSLGMPVIVTTVGAIQDVIEDGREGYLVGPGDIGALSVAIESLVRDGSLREEMGKKAYERWRSELDSGQMARLIKLQWNAALGAEA